MSEKKDYLLSIVVPVYCEEKGIAPFMERVETVMGSIGCRYEVLFCLDPSPDRTYEVIRENIRRNGNIRLIQFSRRFGQPAATMAGILNCSGDICVVIDVDLQDPPELICEMIRKWKEGYEVVYAQRTDRKGETLLKKLVASIGYKVINAMGEVEIPVNTGDYRLMSRKVVEELRGLNEHHGFLRGLVALVGYKQTAVLYQRDARASGKGKYNRFTGSLKIGLNGLICFSTKPLQVMSGIGFLTAGTGILLGIWYFIQKVFLHMDLTPGLSTTVILIAFFGGLQLFYLGVLGEYIGRIYDEVKRRPLYIVDKTENMDEDRQIFCK